MLGPTTHDTLHSLECLVETGGLDRQDDQIGGRCLAGADGREIARLSVDKMLCHVRNMIVVEQSVIHNVFDGVIAEGLGNHAAVEQADAALADKGDLVDLHVNHLPI